MDLAKYCVNAVLVEGRSLHEVSKTTGRSKSWVHRHVVLYRDGGEEALVPKRRGPKSAPNQNPPDLEDAIVEIRKVLGESGYDAGARTIAYHLARSSSCSLPAASRPERRRSDARLIVNSTSSRCISVDAPLSPWNARQHLPFNSVG